MGDFIRGSVYFGALISLGSYGFGMLLKQRLKTPVLNPLFISVAITIIFLLIFHIDYDSYYEGAKYISYLLTPATVCLAIPLYEQLKKLKNNFIAVISGILSGAVTSLCTILAMSFLFKFSHEEYVTFLPKSITTAIGMGVSEELGGYVSITAAVIIITGIIGSIISEFVFRIFKISEPAAKGVALGSASHAIGTAKALELGELEGAVSSLSIVISGIITVAGASIFEKIY